MKTKTFHNFQPFIKWLTISFFIFQGHFTNLKSADSQFRWVIGEELVYKVKWSFIRLGTLKLQVCDTLQMDNRRVYHTKLFIDSNPLIFFVNMHSQFDSYIDDEFFPHLFIADEKIDGITYKTRYRFNYTKSIIDIKMTDIHDTTNTIQRQIPIDEKIQDGMSLIFFARGNIHKPSKHLVTAFYEAKKGKVFMQMKGAAKKLKIDVLRQEVDTFSIKGETHLKTIAGLTGRYEGWFATDPQVPPLYAKLKVFIGNVKVELESWKNWSAGDTLAAR
ncbi:MAG: DUF3108 domain-containing protein [Methanosarcinaceae archaeon]